MVHPTVVRTLSNTAKRSVAKEKAVPDSSSNSITTSTKSVVFTSMILMLVRWSGGVAVSHIMMELSVVVMQLSVANEFYEN